MVIIYAVVCHLIKQLTWFRNILHFYAVLWMDMYCAHATSSYFNIYTLLFLIWLFIPRAYYMTIDLKWWPSITLLFYFSFFAAGNVIHLYVTFILYSVIRSWPREQCLTLASPHWALFMVICQFQIRSNFKTKLIARADYR